jgi:hypothetical protein
LGTVNIAFRLCIHKKSNAMNKDLSLKTSHYTRERLDIYPEKMIETNKLDAYLDSDSDVVYRAPADS